MRHYVKGLLAALGICVATPGWTTDLWDVYQLSLANDPTYQATLLVSEADKLNLPLAEAGFKPTLDGAAQLGRQRNDFTGDSETSDDHFVSLDFNLPLYDRFQRKEITQAEYGVDVSELEVVNAKQDLIIKVAIRYFNVLASRDAREVARLEKIAIQRQLDLASERLEVGLGTRTDLFDAQARFKLAEAEEIRAQNLINTSLAELKQLIGMTPELPLTPLGADAPLDPPQPDNMDHWIEVANENNVVLLIQRNNLNIALEEIDKQRSVRSPTLSLTANHRYSESGSRSSFTDSGFSTSDESNVTSVGVALRFPLYLGGIVDLRTEQAGYLYNRVDRQLEEARRAASTQTTTAYLDVTSFISQVNALFQAITAGESALEAKEEGFSAGLTTNIDVLDAQRDLSQSRTDYLRARYNYILAVLELERAAGMLDEQDVQRVNSWLVDTAQ